MTENIKELTTFIWGVAGSLRGPFKPSEYGKVILPFTVLRRLDCVIENNQASFKQKYSESKKQFGSDVPEAILYSLSKNQFYNTSDYTFESLLKEPEQIKRNLKLYIDKYSDNVRNIMGHFEIGKQIDKLDKSGILYLVVQKFCAIDLHPNRISNMQMGYAFEELIRKFAELSNETAGEHFTPREVIELMVRTIFTSEAEKDHLTSDGKIFKIYDPACGTGGMLSVSDEHLHEHNTSITTALFGQETNEESHAICTSDMMIKGFSTDGNISHGDTLRDDRLKGEKFDYMLCNPPFGTNWEKQEKEVKAEYEQQGFNGRFGAGLPRISDGSFLFLQHMLSKMKDQKDGGSRIAIVFNGSPLFTGSAGGGESNIRRWIIENDWLEAIIALPNDLFYNTGIATYIWILTNRKDKKRKGKVQLINASNLFEKMRKSLGSKRNYITEEQIAKITQLYGNFEETKICKIFDNDDFGYERITVERPLKLRFDIIEENIAILQEMKQFKALATSKKKGDAGDKEIKDGLLVQRHIISILSSNLGKSWTDESVFAEDIRLMFCKGGLKLDAKLLKLLIDVFGKRDENASIVLDSKGVPKPDVSLRDYENVPLKENIEEYFKREVLPHVPDAWIDESKTVRGYEIPFTRHFYKYIPPRSLGEIEEELQKLQSEILDLMRAVV